MHAGHFFLWRIDARHTIYPRIHVSAVEIGEAHRPLEHTVKRRPIDDLAEVDDDLRIVRRRFNHASFCPTFKMSHDHGWRGACAARSVTDGIVGSGAWFGSVGMGIASRAMNFCLRDKITISNWRALRFQACSRSHLPALCAPASLAVRRTFCLGTMSRSSKIAGASFV